MAELLVVASDRPVAPSPGQWEAGEVVAVQADGFQWGIKEGPPNFEVICLPGVSVNAVQHLLTPDTEEVEEETVLLNRRATKLDLDNLRGVGSQSTEERTVRGITRSHNILEVNIGQLTAAQVARS